MRKTISVISVYFLFCVNLLFSQEIQYGRTYYYPSEYGSIVINEDSYTSKSLSGEEKFYKGPVEIEILEVYKGSKYSDVVISGIYFIE